MKRDAPLRKTLFKLNSPFKNAAQLRDSDFSDLANLRGIRRVNWLLSLDGEKLDQMPAQELDITLALLTRLPIDKIKDLSDRETYKALTQLRGVSEHEREVVLRRLRARETLRNQNTEREIREFLEKPYQHMPHAPEHLKNESWTDALLLLDLLKDIVPENKFRKNGVEQERSHFFAPVKDFIASFKDGTLPHEVARKNVRNANGMLLKMVDIPAPQRSAEHLIMLFLMHDSVEDDLLTTPESVKQYLRDHEPPNLSVEDRQFRNDKIDFFIEGLRVITFAYDQKLPNGKVLQKQSDHRNAYGERDLNVYSKNMLPYWHALIVKGKDRKNGLKGRYPHHILMRDFFTIQKDIAYNADTIAVLKHNRILDQAKKNFPDLANYVDALTAHLEIVHRNFEFVTMNHPSTKPDYRKKAKTITASLDISDFAEAVSNTPNFHLKMSDIREQYYSLVVESIRHPDLRPAIKHIGNQLKTYLAKGMKSPPIAPQNANNEISNDNRFNSAADPDAPDLSL